MATEPEPASLTHTDSAVMRTSDSSAAPTPAGATDSAAASETKTESVDDLAKRLSGVSFEVDHDEVKNLQDIFERLVAHMPVSVGKALSAKERDEKGLSMSTLVYGEIAFDSFAITFQKIKRKYGCLQKPGGVFYDIGSGTGKPTLAASLLHDFDKAIGVEILEGLHASSLELLERWNAEIKPTLSAAKQRTEVKFVLGDATKFDWSDATLWFANSTCFDEALMRKLAEATDGQKVGTLAITFTKRLPSDKWEVKEAQVLVQSWGNATVFIQEKKLP